MGVTSFDFWTIMHFVWGIIWTSILIPSRPFESFMVANLLHAYSEYLEQDYYPKTGKHLESLENHKGDISAFLAGSLIGYYYGCKYFTQKGTETLRWTLLIIGILVAIQEICREVFPDTWIINPAYHEYRFFGHYINDNDWYKKLYETVFL